MTRRRFIADSPDGERASLAGANAVHLARVLRVQPGEVFEIAAAGGVRLGTVLSVAEDRVEFALGERVEEVAAAETRLLLAIYKYDRLEWAIEKAVELSVTEIVPVMAQRTEAHLARSATKRVERWRRIARESAQQSRQALVPAIAEPVNLKRALEGITGAKILLSEYRPEVSLWEALPDKSKTAVTLAVGPIGGWTEAELSMFSAHGWIHATMGQSILRAETAVIAALAVVTQKRLAQVASESRQG